MKVQKKKHLAYARKLRHTKIATLSPQMSNDFFVSPKFKTKKLYALAKDSDACDVFLSFAYGFYAYGYFEQKFNFYILLISDSVVKISLSLYFTASAIVSFSIALMYFSM